MMDFHVDFESKNSHAIKKFPLTIVTIFFASIFASFKKIMYNFSRQISYYYFNNFHDYFLLVTKQSVGNLRLQNVVFFKKNAK
jgi:hypothetical protein